MTGGSANPQYGAKAATQTIPIVFVVATDPVEVGLVPSLARPNGNVTGVTLLLVELLAKNLSLMHELVPSASSIGVLINPANPRSLSEYSRSSILRRIRFREGRHQESNFPLLASKRTQMRIPFPETRRFANTRTGS